MKPPFKKKRQEECCQVFRGKDSTPFEGCGPLSARLMESSVMVHLVGMVDPGNDQHCKVEQLLFLS